jgi:bacterioferritin-associated ferredoxin
MLICLCHPTSHHEIEAVIDDGARSVDDIGRRCGAGTGCGACVGELQERLASRGCGGPRDCAGAVASIRAR